MYRCTVGIEGREAKHQFICFIVTVCIEKMLSMGFTLKEIQESLTESRYDEVCATYMLLVRDDDVKEVSSPWVDGGGVGVLWVSLIEAAWHYLSYVIRVTV